MAQTQSTSIARTQQGRLGGAHAWWVWTLSVLFVVYLFSVQTGYSVVNADIGRDVALSVTQISTIAAVYTWVFAVCQFFGGALLDRLGAHKVLPLSVALVTAGVFLFANATSYPMLLASQFVMAIGACTGFVGGGYIGGQWFGMAKFNFMFGLVQLCASLSSAFSVTALQYALAQMHWRMLFNYVGASGVILTVLAYIYLRNPAPVEQTADSIGGFFKDVIASLNAVMKIFHVWICALICAALFGSLLAGGVVWTPKLMAVRGASPEQAAFSASLLWLGLAAGCLVLPAWSDMLRRRKLPIVLGCAVQLACASAILYVPVLPIWLALLLNFIFGFANAAHMLTFSSAADVVPPQLIGTSAALVNGLAFIAGGIMIARPGARVAMGEAEGLTQHSLALAQYAALPIVVALVVALLLSLVMRESYPKQQ
ncbi:MFS transporter [Cupriavidus pauculus]|jgi:MFS family permease|uniref:MFS transporter n=1 Tax=Cupriavidus pauculus TaxID=82633 RepID=UPI003857B669